MMETLKTFTLGDDDDNPLRSLCPGHVDAQTFTKAWIAEGWDSEGTFDSGDLRHEWWVNNGETWKVSTEGVPGAQAVTVMDW
jgi:hypothetical protein